MILIITIHANGVCVKGWLEKKGKYSRKWHEWQPLFRAHHYHQHHHQIIAINIDKNMVIMVIIDKNSGEAKTFNLHSMSVHVHLT